MSKWLRFLFFAEKCFFLFVLVFCQFRFFSVFAFIQSASTSPQILLVGVITQNVERLNKKTKNSKESFWQQKQQKQQKQNNNLKPTEQSFNLPNIVDLF